MEFSRFRRALSRTAMAIMGGAFGLWLLLIAIVGLLLWHAREGELQEAKLRGTATTALLQAHTVNTFQAVDNALVEMARTIERESPPQHDIALRAEMRRRLASMPYVRALFVIGPDGHILHDTDYPSTPDVSLADRPYFQQYLQPKALVTPISAPMQSRSGLGWFVAVSRKIGQGDDFHGVAVAAIRLAYFSALYQKVGLEEGSEILLFHRDGRLIAQYPSQSGAIGESYATFPLFRVHLPEAPSGAYLTSGGPLSYVRVVNYAATPKFPLVVGQVQNVEARLGAWYQWVLVTAAGMLLLLAAMLYAAASYVRARLEQQRDHERRLQGEKMEALGQLTGGIAHDFANVLGVVSTNLSLLDRLGGPDGRTQAALSRARRAVESGTALTRQLMTFSRKRELQVVAADVNDAIGSMLGLLEQAGSPHCRVLFKPAERRLSCRLDPSQFEAALINLVVNARHATPGQGQITIATRSLTGRELGLSPGCHADRFVCVSIRDDGEGMTEEVRRRAIEPFFTTKGEAGTGFGLAQVYGMMKQLGGELAIESKTGIGTTVHLCFPAIPSPQ